MGEFDYRVERQRVLLEAEEWAKGISSVQYHGLTSMWYETKETELDAVKGVTDTQFMDGRIERVTHDGKKYIIKQGLTGEDLVQEVSRNLADSGRQLGE